MRTGSSKDKVINWLKENKVDFIRAGAVIAIAVIVGAIMIPDIAVTHGKHDAAVNRMEQAVSHVGSEIADQSKVVQSINADLMATEDEVKALAATVGTYDGAIETLDARADATDATIERVEENVAAVEEALAAIDASAPEAWLTGVAGNYTLHAKSSRNDTYTATIYLHYEEPIAFEDFFGSMDWEDEHLQHYMPMMTVAMSGNTTALMLTGVSFNIGTFTLEADEEDTREVLYGGIHEDYKPDWAYVEIWPVVTE